MPEYLFKDKNTGKEWTEWMSISERTEYLEKNPHIEQLVFGFPGMGYNTVTRKPDQWFRDKLSDIKKKHPKSTIGSKYNDWGSRSC